MCVVFLLRPLRKFSLLASRERVFSFLENINKWGRVYETALLPAYLLKSGELKQKWHAGTYRHDLKLGLQMLAKGRFPLLPKTIKGKKEVRKLLAQPNPDKPELKIED